MFTGGYQKPFLYVPRDLALYRLNFTQDHLHKYLSIRPLFNTILPAENTER